MCTKAWKQEVGDINIFLAFDAEQDVVLMHYKEHIFMHQFKLILKLHSFNSF